MDILRIRMDTSRKVGVDTSYFPERWKITRVVGTCTQVGAGTNVNGVRPVTTLSTTAKVAEPFIGAGFSKLSDGFRQSRGGALPPTSSTTYGVHGAQRRCRVAGSQRLF